VIHGLELDVPAGGCIAPGRESGRRQVDDGEARRALLRPRRGRRAGRRIDLASTAALVPAPARCRAPGPVPLQRHDRRQPRFARPEATDAEISAAARAIGVDRVAARFEGGLEHVVREGGSGLSAGERQLISIARALVADPRILILDEATSNIDRPSEVLIERAFDTLLRGRTSLIIAHRIATVRRADEIVVLEHGRIVQRGSYDELIGIDGAFRRLAIELEGADERRVA
jgi:ATP-binding cassette subfamily B protein